MKKNTLGRGRPARALPVTGGLAIAVCSLALAGCGATATSTGGSSSNAGAPAGTTPASIQSTAPSGSSPPATAKSTGPPLGDPVSGTGSSSFQVLSMTFVSDQQGFALGTVTCGTTRCLAVLGTTDGGLSWRKLAAPAAHPGGPYGTCPSGRACVSQLRFATPTVGYAFDPSLFITTDGGQLWRRVRGLSVTSLEAAGGSVARVASADTGCAGQPYDVQSAPVGSAGWRLLDPPRILMICPPVLYRQGQRLVLAGFGNPAGGVRATAQIVRSGDGGGTWTSGPDQCGGRDGYASAVAIAPPDVLVLLCRHQMPDAAGDFGPPWVRVSVDGGATFGGDQVVRAPDGLLTSDVTGYQLAAASASRLLVVVTGPHAVRAYLSENGGGTWSSTLAADGSAPAIEVGFEDPLTARIAQGDLVWTTYDGGRHWITGRLPG